MNKKICYKKEKVYYAVLNPKWREWEWDNMFYEPAVEARNVEGVHTLAIFSTRKAAVEFKKSAPIRGDKIVKIKIEIVK